MDYHGKIARVFYLALPHTFGKDTRKDIDLISHVGRLATSDGGTGPRESFEKVMKTVHGFFAGHLVVGLLASSKTSRGHGVLNHLDSGFFLAFGENSSERPGTGFEEKKKDFFDAVPYADDLLRTYQTKKGEYLHALDETKGSVLKEEALRAGVHLVILAHGFQAAQDGRIGEAVFARKLVEILNVISGMCASQLTRNHVYEGLKVAAVEYNGPTDKTVEDSVKNEMFLRRMA